MTTWTIYWTQDGYVEIEAKSRDEALEAFSDMPFQEARAFGDCDEPNVYYVQAED